MRFFILLIFTVVLFSCRPKPQVAAQESVAPERVLIHNQFDITQEELLQLVSDQPQSIAASIMSRPNEFLELVNAALDLPEKALVLVDKQHALSAEDGPGVIIHLDDYPEIVKNRAGHQVSAWAFPALQSMIEAAEEEAVTLMVSSTYRPYARQKSIYQWCVENYGQEEADRVSAFPGKSQHQLGHTIDFGSISEEYEFTEAGQWQLKNAWKYGWSLSYPEGMEELTGYKYEVWHYRYITPVGTAMQREFFDNIQQYFLMFWHENKEFLKSRRNLDNITS